MQLRRKHASKLRRANRQVIDFTVLYCIVFIMLSEVCLMIVKTSVVIVKALTQSRLKARHVRRHLLIKFVPEAVLSETGRNSGLGL